jgi:hypothetical protein
MGHADVRTRPPHYASILSIVCKGRIKSDGSITPYTKNETQFQVYKNQNTRNTGAVTFYCRN